jgi:hypothetical protein
MSAPATAPKRPRDDSGVALGGTSAAQLKHLAARLSSTSSEALAALLVGALPGGAAAALALLPAPRTDNHLEELQKAARAVQKNATCRYSVGNAFSLGRARGAIAALKAALRKQAAALGAAKDANAVATWATGAIDIIEGAHEFDPGLNFYKADCKAVVGAWCCRRPPKRKHPPASALTHTHTTFSHSRALARPQPKPRPPRCAPLGASPRAPR